MKMDTQIKAKSIKRKMTIKVIQTKTETARKEVMVLAKKTRKKK